MGAATGITGAVEYAAEEAIVTAIQSEAVERALSRVLQGPALEEAVARAMDSPAVERALTRAIDSEMVDRVWDQLLASDQAQKLVERIAEAPEVRSALASQGVGFVEDIGEEAARVTRRLDDILELVARRLLLRPRRAGTADRAGAATRTLAFALDAALLNVIFLAASSLLDFVASAVLGDGSSDTTGAIVIGTALWTLFGGAYLFAFWALVGQTPGMRFLGIALDAGGERRIGGRRALRRVVGLVLSVIPLGIGLLRALYDERRRGWHDSIAGTQVVFVDRSSSAPYSRLDRERPA